MTGLFKRGLSFFRKEEGGKNVFQKKRIAGVFGISIIFAVVYGAFPRQKDTSFANKSAKPLSEEKPVQVSSPSPLAKGVFGNQADSQSYLKYRMSGNEAGVTPRSESGERKGIQYKAVQIVERKGGDPERTLPIGSSFIGRLITAIDTRESNQMVRVILPYGGSFDHDRRIDKDSVIFGRASYPGQGEKVYVQFNRLLFPDGTEFKIEAEALNSKDYSSGLIGNEHDGAASRMLGTIGLTMLSGMTDVLTEKEQLGELGPPTPKSTLHNAFMHGVSQATENEGQRQASKVSSQKDYVTIPKGQDVIVSLIETFHGEQR